MDLLNHLLNISSIFFRLCPPQICKIAATCTVVRQQVRVRVAAILHLISVATYTLSSPPARLRLHGKRHEGLLSPPTPRASPRAFVQAGRSLKYLDVLRTQLSLCDTLLWFSQNVCDFPRQNRPVLPAIDRQLAFTASEFSSQSSSL